MSSKVKNSKTDVSVHNAGVQGASKLSEENDCEVASDALLDEAMNILAGYEEGCSVKDLKGFSDCGCHDSSSKSYSLSAPKLKE